MAGGQSGGWMAAGASVSPWPARCCTLVDLGLLGILFLAPLFMGGRGPVGRLVFGVFVAVMTSAWCLRQIHAQRAAWRWTGVEWLLAAGLGVLILQLAPLPTELLTRLSPGIVDLLPGWQSEGGLGLGGWNRLSLYPAGTLSGLFTYTTYVLLFLVVVQRIQRLEDIERLLRWVALAAIGMACLGLAQMLLGNGKFLWIYEHPWRTTQGVAKGSFQNQNHFAHLLVLGVGPLIWWLQTLHRPSKSGGSRGRGRPEGFSARGTAGPDSTWPWQAMLLWGGLAIVSLAILLTYSRGGVLAFSVAIMLCLGIGLRQSWFNRRSLTALCGLAGLLGVALAIYGYEPLMGKLQTMGAANDLAQLSAGRQALWAALAAAIPKFWLTGTGAGTHAFVYRAFLREHFEVEFTHAESGYLHLLLETGAVGFGLFLLGVAIATFWSLRVLSRPTDRAVAGLGGAIVPGLAASLVQAVADFAWYIPACMAVTVILLACLRRLTNFARQSEDAARAPAHQPWMIELPRPVWIATTCFIVLALAAMARERVPAALAAPPWDAYRKLAQSPREQQLDPTTLAAITERLSRVVALTPWDARAQNDLAVHQVRRFEVEQLQAENPMPLSQIRDAALASQFPSREAQDEWLGRAVGQNKQLLDDALKHAKSAVRLCPLQGESYVMLAGLSFLEGARAQRKLDYIGQALRVRPHSGLVLHAAGIEAALEQQPALAMKYWKAAFHLDPDVRAELIQLLAPRLRVEDLLEQLQPDLAGLNALYDYYSRAGQAPIAQALAAQIAPRIEEQAQTTADLPAAAALWHQASELYARVQQPADSLRCAREAVAASPATYAYRSALAGSLIEAQQYAEAIAEWEWCLQRKPGDRWLLDRLADARRRQMQSSLRTASEGATPLAR